MAKTKVLFAGESWFITTTETKGFDQFTIGGYETEIGRIIEYLGDDFEVTHLPSHLVLTDFPQTIDELKKYDVVIISDVGSNTFYLHPDTFQRTMKTPNRLELLKEYVEQGGALGMAGGYLTFQGFEAKGKWHRTPVEDVLPVDFYPYDDREEHPEGISLSVDTSKHEMLKGFPEKWPELLGYNKAVAKPDAKVLVEYKGDPILAIREVGKGRTFTWSSDIAPHWMPTTFCGWEFNSIMWQRLVKWAANK